MRLGDRDLMADSADGHADAGQARDLRQLGTAGQHDQRRTDGTG